MSQPELLKKVVDVLDEHTIPYMITGSLASTFYGEPRATHDIDVVVGLKASEVPALAGAFAPPVYYLDPDAARDAIRRQGMFNVIDVLGGDKVDFWLLTSEPFDKARFARRRREDLGYVNAYLSSAEDTILAKMRWANLAGGSEKQIGDAASVLELNQEGIDRRYLAEWVATLGLDREWAAVLARLR